MLIDKLREHLASITEEEFLKEWNELDEWKDIGPTAKELIESWTYLYPTNEEI